MKCRFKTKTLSDFKSNNFLLQSSTIWHDMFATTRVAANKTVQKNVPVTSFSNFNLLNTIWPIFKIINLK